MYFFIAFGVLIAISIILLIINSHKWYSDLTTFVCGTILILCLFAAIACGFSLLTIEKDFDYIEAQYNNLKEQVDYVDYDYILTDANLRNQVLEMNNTIAKHYTYCDNPWLGLWYSERIGNLENLEW